MKNKEKVTSLTKSFEELYFIEKQARDIYNGFLETLKDKKEIEVISKIRNDEMRHMNIVKDLIELTK